MPNIEGENIGGINVDSAVAGVGVNGAFVQDGKENHNVPDVYNIAPTGGYFSNGPTASMTPQTVFFDASLSNPIYGNSNTVQPNSLTIVYLIKY